MSESHLARSLFSQPTSSTVRKKVVPNSTQQSPEPSTDRADISPEISPMTEETDQSEASAKSPKPAKTATKISSLAVTPVPKSADDQNYQMLQSNYAQLQSQYQDLQLAHSQLQQDYDRSTELTKSLQASLGAQMQECQQQAQQLESLTLVNQELELQIAQLQQTQADSAPTENSHMAELQAQIDRQAKQLQENQATIQHWREQSLKHHQHAIQLGGALERLLENRQPVQSPQTEPIPEPVKEPEVTAPPLEPVIKGRQRIELPSFLARSRD